MNRKILILSLSLLLSLAPSSKAFADEDVSEANDGITFQSISPEFNDFLRDANKDNNNDGYLPEPFEISYDNVSYNRQMASNFPESFDLRDVNKLTPIRDQGPNGSCWAFAAYSSLESTLMPEYHDFSEKHMRNTHSYDWGPGDGGNRSISAAYLARWSGPIDEKDDPYSPYDFYSNRFLERSMDTTSVWYLPDKTTVESNMDIIKSNLMRYGAIQTGMHANDYFLNRRTWAHYNNRPIADNHAIAIVGWDDNYSRNNFKNKPPRDGAWLIRNSWGERMGIGGYYWISYYDFNVASSNALYLARHKGRNTNIYQYDWLGMTTSFGFNNGEGYMANVFPSQSYDQYLNTAGFFTSAGNADYEIYLVDNYKDEGSFSNMKKIKSGHIDYAGYHSIDFGSQKIKANNKFSVIVKLSTDSTRYPLGIEKPIRGYSSRARAGYGESYVSSNGYDWDDLSAIQYGTNACVKAFTSKRPSSVIENDNPYDVPGNTHTYTLNYNEKDLSIGERFKLDYDSDKEVTWESSDENIAYVDKDGNVTAKSEGEVIIKVSDGSHTDQARIRVYPNKKERVEIGLDKDSYPMNEDVKVKLKAFDRYQRMITGQPIKVNVTTPSGEVLTINKKTDKNANAEASVILNKINEIGLYTVETSARIFGKEVKNYSYFYAKDYENKDKHTYKLSENEKDLAIGEKYKLDFDSDKEITWDSSNEDIAYVDKDGNIIARSEGEVNITAKSQDKSDTALIRVSKNKGARIEIGLDKKDYHLNELVKIKLKAFDRYQRMITGQPIKVNITTPSGEVLSIRKVTDKDANAEVLAYLDKIKEKGLFTVEACGKIFGKEIKNYTYFNVDDVEIPEEKPETKIYDQPEIDNKPEEKEVEPEEINTNFILKDTSFDIKVGDKIDVLKKENPDLKFTVDDENIVRVIDNKVIAIGEGETKVIISDGKEEKEVKIKVSERKEDEDRISPVYDDKKEDSEDELNFRYRVFSSKNELITNFPLSIKLTTPSKKEYTLKADTDEEGNLDFAVDRKIFEEEGSYEIEVIGKIGDKEIKYYDVFDIE